MPLVKGKPELYELEVHYLVTFHLHCMENLEGRTAIPDAPPSPHTLSACLAPSSSKAVQAKGVTVQEKLPKVPCPLSDPGSVAQPVGVLTCSSSLGERWGFLNVGAFVLERNF